MSVLINQKKVNGGVVSSPGRNVTVWYDRQPSDKFIINGSFNGLENPYDWVLVKETDSKWIKSGIVTFNSERKSTVVKFTSPFVNEDYYVFFLTNSNTNLYWNNKKANQFTINGGFSLGSEVSWLAIHKKIGQQTGIRTPKSIYVGERVLINDYVQWDGNNFIAGDDPLNPPTLPLPADSTGEAIPPPPGTYDSACNLNGWYKNELIIRPDKTLDGIATNNLMNFTNSSDYSTILSSNVSINTYWSDKRADRVKIGTSYPIKCIINYLFIKTGLNWWDEI
jgi:hypothetical protein